MLNAPMSHAPITRRNLVNGTAAAAAAGVLVAALPPLARADETASALASDSADVWGDAPRDPAEFDIAEEVSCDVLVVGAGTAGMPCAIAAAEEGLSVVVLEKTPTGFGMRNYIGAVGSALQAEKGVEIDKRELERELLRYSSYRANAALVRQWAERSGEAVDWYSAILQEGGMKPWLEVDINPEGTTHFKEYSTCHMHYDPERNGLTEGAVMAERMAAAGCDARFSTPMVQLVQEDGVVTGAIAELPEGGYLKVTASRGVVLATGGYAGDLAMVQALNPKDYAANVMLYCSPGATGDGVRAAHHAGGQMDLTHTAMYFERGCTMPGSKGGDLSTPGLWWMGSQPFLQVNAKGERFANESLPYDYDLHQAACQPGTVMVQVFDANWVDDVKAFHTVGCSRIVDVADIPNGYEAVAWNFDKINAASFGPALEAGQLVQANTIEELAAAMGMDPAVLSATVERYNELCAKGDDEDFGKEPWRMRPVAEPPFYAVTVGGQLLCTMDGMWIDTQMRVLDANGDPVPGLYAIGNDSGRFFSDCYPELVVGVAAGRSLTFGYLLGKELAAQEA